MTHDELHLFYTNLLEPPDQSDNHKLTPSLPSALTAWTPRYQSSATEVSSSSTTQ